MARTENEIGRSLEKKLLKTGGEVIPAILSGGFLAIYALLALNATGLLAVAGWFIVGVQVLAMLMRMVGWKVITLTNDEQDYLKKNTKVTYVEKAA